MTDNRGYGLMKDDPHDVKLSEDTRYGFIFEGVHFERMCSDKSGIYVWIGSKKQQKIVRVTRGGKITIQDVN